MDGVFMRKLKNSLLFCLVLTAVVWLCGIAGDKRMLRRELVRLHVVAASDSAEDQALKLRVKDAVVQSLTADMERMGSAVEAKAYLRENLPKIQALANRVLADAGSGDTAAVSLGEEAFSTRVYDTFTLPAGVYDALRITIGPGEGQNWWCVAFPSLCLPATASGFEEAASCAGFSDTLTGTLEGEEEYELRFWVLDAWGRLENFLHRA